MDMSFANQFLALKQLWEQGKTMGKTVHILPEEQDQEIAQIKLETQGMSIDTLTEEQKTYAEDYSAGT